MRQLTIPLFFIFDSRAVVLLPSKNYFVRGHGFERRANHAYGHRCTLLTQFDQKWNTSWCEKRANKSKPRKTLMVALTIPKYDRVHLFPICMVCTSFKSMPPDKIVFRRKQNHSSRIENQENRYHYLSMMPFGPWKSSSVHFCYNCQLSQKWSKRFYKTKSCFWGQSTFFL